VHWPALTPISRKIRLDKLLSVTLPLPSCTLRTRLYRAQCPRNRLWGGQSTNWAPWHLIVLESRRLARNNFQLARDLDTTHNLIDPSSATFLGRGLQR
jgi:hypothetical protein